jgi:MFS family permease
MQAHRRITLAVGVSMFVDASLYLAVLPLLPRYVERFGLNTLEAAAILAAYPISVPFVSLACVVLVPRVGARRISLGSALLMTVATVIFAWAPSVAVLILARFVQGLASGSIWTASMSWVTDNAPPEGRGRESGIVMGMLSAGSVAGPGIGALAAVAGSGLAFGLVAAISAAGVIFTLLAPLGRNVAGESDLVGSIRRGARQPATQAALAMAVIDLCAFGSIDLLVPLHLGATGRSVTVIAAALALGALLGAAVGPIGGRLVDRVGPAAVGLPTAVAVLVAPVILAFTPGDSVQLALLVIGGPLFAVVGAAMFPLSALGADAAGVSHVTVMGLMGAVWAGGFTLVPLGLGVAAQAFSTPTAFVLAVLLCIPTIVWLARSVHAAVRLATPEKSRYTSTSGTSGR